jgi:hypothetical protein
MSLELTPVEARRLAFHQRRRLVHIQGPFLDGHYTAFWFDDITNHAGRYYLEKQDQEALIDALEGMERDGCPFGPVIKLNGHGDGVQGWSGLEDSAEDESEQPRFDAKRWSVRGG